MVPGRAFTRRLYAYTTSNGKLKPHHHIHVNSEMRRNLETWSCFINSPEVYCRPFLDYTEQLTAQELDFYSDASGSIGYGAVCRNLWMYGTWDPDFLKEEPSIEFLELYALVAAVLAWMDRYKNKRVILFCDNQGVVSMVNKTTLSCKNCMNVIRLFVLHCMKLNTRVFARYVKTRENTRADQLSRGKLRLFKSMNPQYGRYPTPVPELLIPVSKVFQ